MFLSNVTLSESKFKRFFNIILENFSINPKDDDGCQMLNKIKKEDLNNGTSISSLFILVKVVTNINIIKKYLMFFSFKK